MTPGDARDPSDANSPSRLPTQGPTFHVNTKDIPQGLLDEIREHVWLFSGIAFRVREAGPEHVGVVTFVTANNRPYLLTAAHVWAELSRDNQFALSLEGDRPLLQIQSQFVQAKVFSGPYTTGIGPDLALIELPPLIATQIRTLKVFYNLDLRRDAARREEPDYEDVVWAVLGPPAEQSRFEPGEVTLRITLFVSGVNRAWTADGFDYVEIGYSHEHRPDLPNSYGGLSGSGLWHIPIVWSISKNALVVKEPFDLEGVAFYQQRETDSSGVIRCHGRRSLYGPLLQQ